MALHSLDVEALVVEKKMRHTSLHAPSTIFSCTAEGRDLSNSVDFVIDLCRNYKRGGNDSYASLWLATLDKLISLKTIALSESYKRVEIVLVRSKVGERVAVLLSSSSLTFSFPAAACHVL